VYGHKNNYFRAYIELTFKNAVFDTQVAWTDVNINVSRLEETRYRHIGYSFFNTNKEYFIPGMHFPRSQLDVRWVVGSIPLGGTIKLFLVPASAPQLV